MNKKYRIYFVTPAGRKVYIWAAGTRYSVNHNDAVTFECKEPEKLLKQVRQIFEDRFNNGNFSGINIFQGIKKPSEVTWHIVEAEEKVAA